MENGLLIIYFSQFLVRHMLREYLIAFLPVGLLTRFKRLICV